MAGAAGAKPSENTYAMSSSTAVQPAGRLCVQVPTDAWSNNGDPMPQKNAGEFWFLVGRF